MKAKVLERYIRPILEDPELEHIRTIRIGTKSVAYWPQRYVSDADADDVLRLFEDVVKSGHPRHHGPLLPRRGTEDRCLA